MPALTEILSEDDLKLIRRLFDNETMVQAGIASVSGSYARALPWNEIIMNQFYREDDGPFPENQERVMERADIERVVIGILAAKRESWALAVHMYWGMCCKRKPLEPGEIAEILLLTSTYAGADVMSEGSAVLGALLELLKELAAEAREKKLVSDKIEVAGATAVVGQIMGKLFPLVG